MAREPELRGPGVAHGAQIQDLVELVDIAPTILDAAGIRLQTATSGRSFYQALAGRATISDDVGLAEIPAKQMYALRLGKLKLISSPERVELYDLSQDPGETTDLAPSRRGEVSRLKRLLRELLGRRRTATEVTESPTPRQREALEALGYLR